MGGGLALRGGGPVRGTLRSDGVVLDEQTNIMGGGREGDKCHSTNYTVAWLNLE